jgi:hypothetical protein
MKRKVVVTLEVDPMKYFGALNTEEGAVELVLNMLYGYSDIPYDTVKVSCGDVTKTHNDLPPDKSPFLN